MRAEAECWLYGEGPDNALTFEWRMHLAWLIRHRQWARLPQVIASYLTGKPLADWGTTLGARLAHFVEQSPEVSPESVWVRCAASRVEQGSSCMWRPEAHGGLSSALWPQMFELQDAAYAPFGIDLRHPYMDLRVLEFLLAVPPIPWGRRKRLIRDAMKGQLPKETLRRVKTPLYKNIMPDLLRQHLPAMPRTGDPIEAFVEIDKLLADAATYPDVYALTRVAILQHWLKARHG